MSSLVTKRCTSCSEIMHGVDPRKLLCDRCRKEHIRENKRKQSRRNTSPYDQEPRRIRRASGMTRLDIRIAEADRLGMSYGKYVAMLYAEKSGLNRR